MLEILRKVQIPWSCFSSFYSIYVHMGWLLIETLLFWLGWKNDGPRQTVNSHGEEIFAPQPCTDGFARKAWMMTTDLLFPTGTPLEGTPAFSIQPLPLQCSVVFSALSFNLSGLEKHHTVRRRGLNLNSPFILHCNNLLVPLTFAVNRELGHLQWLARMKGNTSPQLWKHQHLLYFSCYLWPGDL